MKYEVAKALDLVSQIKVVREVKLQLWYRDISMFMGVLPEVLVKLSDEVEFICEMLVFPSPLGEEMSHLPPLLMDNGTLR